MQVILDISVMGGARTGNFRMTDYLARGLAASPECDMALCTLAYPEVMDNCLAYYQQQPQLQAAPMLYADWRKTRWRLSRRISLLNSQLKEASTIKASCQARKYDELLRELQLSKRALRHLLTFVDAFIQSSHRADMRHLHQADIFHSFFFPISSMVRRQSQARRFLTVSDLVPILYPQYLEAGTVRTLQEALAQLQPDDWVCCISQSTKNDLCNTYDFDPARVFVTHLAASPEIFYPCTDEAQIAALRSRYTIPDGPYLLSLCTLEPRKNIDHVIRCFARLVREENISDLSLVLVGGKGWLYDKIFETISGSVAEQAALKKRIIITGYAPDEELAALYSGATAFVYPSFYEGFGLPPLEAMQCGLPVITSNNSSLPEVVGDGGIMLDASDADGLCQSVLDLLHSPTLRQSLAERALVRARQFSWQKTIDATISAYKVALSS